MLGRVGQCAYFRGSASTGSALASLILSAALVAGCNPQRTEQLFREVRGPEPRLQGDDIQEFTARQEAAVTALVRHSALSAAPPPGSRDWNLVVQAGLHYVDEKCEVYMQALDEFDRHRDALKSGVALTGAATAATLGILEVASEAIAIVGTAFGLTTALIDVGSNTVLYSIEPGAVRQALAKSQRAYRTELMKRAIDSRPEALAAVQGYLALCLPVTLATTINTAVATADVRATETTADNPIPSIVINPGRTEVLDVEQPVPPTARLTLDQSIASARSDVERQIDPEMGRRIQAALCVAEDADFGAETREAIRLYRRARLVPANDPTLEAPLTQSEVDDIRRAGECAGPAGYRNAYERFRFDSEEEIRRLQAFLAARTDQDVSLSGRFDEATREAIRTLSRNLALGESDVVTPELVNQLAE